MKNFLNFFSVFKSFCDIIFIQKHILYFIFPDEKVLELTARNLKSLAVRSTGKESCLELRVTSSLKYTSITKLGKKRYHSTDEDDYSNLDSLQSKAVM